MTVQLGRTTDNAKSGRSRYIGQETGIGIMVGYASGESEDDMAFTHSMTRMVICGG